MVKRPHGDKIIFSLVYLILFFDMTCEKLNLGHFFIRSCAKSSLAHKVLKNNIWLIRNRLCLTCLIKKVQGARTASMDLASTSKFLLKIFVKYILNIKLDRYFNCIEINYNGKLDMFLCSISLYNTKTPST